MFASCDLWLLLGPACSTYGSEAFDANDDDIASWDSLVEGACLSCSHLFGSDCSLIAPLAACCHVSDRRHLQHAKASKRAWRGLCV